MRTATTDTVDNPITLTSIPQIENSKNQADLSSVDLKYDNNSDYHFDTVLSKDDILLRQSLSFISSLQDVLNKKRSAQILENYITSSCTWINPFIASGSDAREGLEKFSNFFNSNASNIIVFNQRVVTTDTVEVTYQLSFWYPLPWRPRIIIPAKALLKFSPTTSSDVTYVPSPTLEDHNIAIQSQPILKITSILEQWEVSPSDIFFRQMPPRWWDFWHGFCSPTPEYPPIRQLGQKMGAVRVLELPQSLNVEIQWTGSSKYPGPPLLAVPGFGLFGSLKMARPNREPYQTSLPVEVRSGRFTCPTTGEDMKRSSWLLHVPTALQSQVMQAALSSQSQPIYTESLLEAYEKESRNEDKTGSNIDVSNAGAATSITPAIAEEVDEVDEVDYQVGYENLSIMRGVTGGALRGRVNVDKDSLREFEAKERKAYRYTLQPKRKIAAVDLQGDVDAERIAKALSTIRSSGYLQKGGGYRVKQEGNEEETVFGLQLWGTKACFNLKGQPAMAIYEMQYDYRVTTVFLELEDQKD
eukprot:CAMPEP_0170079326 /NCGR_PEP_ID=MMETSP0019_2-20121128/15736_1 /TAXON_ID=98059 /ORGANISM="Dinobryon sp., Strain UTEXLB2267" /LENGTH=527 /DNA_ID=CAMNT_0010292729 /DNA_START=160 /DNA_END=1743 /DNA_ORIENTATION=-